MACLVGVAHLAQVRMARDRGVVAFSHGREAAVRRLSPGDRVIYYAPRTDFDGDPVQAFVAHARVTGDAPYQTEWRQGVTPWVRDAAFDQVEHLPVKSLIESLSFIRNPARWGMAFRQGKFRISEDDYAIIARGLMGEVP